MLPQCLALIFHYWNTAYSPSPQLERMLKSLRGFRDEPKNDLKDWKTYL